MGADLVPCGEDGDAGLPDVVRLELRHLLEEDGVLFARYAVPR